MDDGAVIRVRRYGNAAGPRLVVSHGNGFAIDAYYPFWRLLLDRYDVVVFDLRNHGRNPLHELACHDLPQFVSDFECLWQGIEAKLGPKTTAGIFHSISAITSVRHALERSWRWDALIAVDPPFVPSPGHALYDLAHDLELRLCDWARERQQRFRDPGELAGILTRTKSRRR
jgi:pimeloyl-ACP methyl ester carboxylesterase